jgi:signal peptidase I
VFGFLKSNERRMRENADNWLQLADKISHYRRDQLTSAQAQGLLQRIAELRFALKQRADAGKLKLGIEALEGVLQQIGGTFYPKSSMVENVEFFLVAAIIILGARTYFLQPFKIPTNSMWPTYYGMTGDNLPAGARLPGLVERVFRFAAFGAQRRETRAPRGGEVVARFFPNGTLAYTVRNDRKWLIVPTQVREYTFSVAGVDASVRVPLDFHDFDRLVQETYFKSAEDFRKFIENAGRNGTVERSTALLREGDSNAVPVFLIRLGRTVRAGDPIIRFDILTGDQLFVDRVSYHFMRPEVGDGFVFRTRNIAGIGLDQYYVKRLVGVPGDTLEIRQPVLYRNGRPISGAAAFEKNAGREGLYRGYFNTPRDARFGGSYLFKGETLTVPAGAFFAMGDNSGNSQDGRYWGFVPEKDVIGRPLCIYYPFTRRWGPAR